MARVNLGTGWTIHGNDRRFCNSASRRRETPRVFTTSVASLASWSRNPPAEARKICRRSSSSLSPKACPWYFCSGSAKLATESISPHSLKRADITSDRTMVPSLKGTMSLITRVLDGVCRTARRQLTRKRKAGDEPKSPSPYLTTQSGPGKTSRASSSLDGQISVPSLRWNTMSIA
jgi:hypothetical protein